VPLAHLGLLAGLSQGRLLVALALVGTWVSDAGAYSCGRLAGRHLLAPDLSPKKTVEGAAGGLVLTVVVVGAGAPHFLDLSTAQAVLAGAVISVFGQAGDLFESALKRTLEVKDLGRLLPGHGGMLDRVDSLLFAAPALYYLLLFL
jgi:phosphatidate cytidylyltransferase